MVMEVVAEAMEEQIGGVKLIVQDIDGEVVMAVWEATIVEDTDGDRLLVDDIIGVVAEDSV